MKSFYETYFNDFSKALKNFIENASNEMLLERIGKIVSHAHLTGSTIYLIGNGGSAAIAEHMAIDMTKNAKMRALAFSSAATITCISNDLNYENVYKKLIAAYCKKGDVLFAISSGGESANIINAVHEAKKIGMKVVTLTGFNKFNSISNLGDENIWIESHAYGYVEILHNLLLHYISDNVIGSAIYKIVD